ncbi:DUF4365 domain-containing protein [Actinosynnema sp. NPDC047251]|uniref:DUF4365 domain-containing protein n=1 Tax=Saccharothrix espanaensis (strain ATCC 51144 / DSM 44229 / JCM 9112 / NBRC 15066 / NRRL 15764) TaxID=1179773 RepID=K0K485_SACES|nr:DUF4365 domain-containing protein [Saccharothrix espanaensis]CCH33096.1 hypothetical protein BN6_58380 [Saccharothrix espanaensis DSM 44229]
MSSVDPKRIIEDRAVNRVTALMQEHSHIVQKIDGHNDFGEDLYVRFVEGGRTTGDTIAVQVKGGVSYRAGGGYRVKVGRHGSSWLKSNVPVVCVVHDPGTDQLYWANASQQLRRARADGEVLRSIAISRTDVLSEASMPLFVGRMREYVAERGQLRLALSELSGQVFDTTDYISFWMNKYGEEMVYHQRRGDHSASLLHHDWDWRPIEITPEALTRGDRYAALGLTTLAELADFLGNAERGHLAEQLPEVGLRSFVDTPPVVGDTFIVNQGELAWLRACADASRSWRSAPALPDV